MIPTKIWVVVAALALVACEDKSPQLPMVSQVFPNLPLPPQASVVSRSGSPEAMQITLTSSATAQDVEAYYRGALGKNGWRLVKDSRDSEGTIALLAEQEGRPLWIRIKGTDDGRATVIELAGTIVADSVRRPRRAS